MEPCFGQGRQRLLAPNVINKFRLGTRTRNGARAEYYGSRTCYLFQVLFKSCPCFSASLILLFSASLLLCPSTLFCCSLRPPGCSNNYNYAPCSATVAKQALVLAGSPKRDSAESRQDVLQKASEEPISAILLSIYLSISAQHLPPPILPPSSSPRLAPLPRLLSSPYHQSGNLPLPRLGPS